MRTLTSIGVFPLAAAITSVFLTSVSSSEAQALPPAVIADSSEGWLADGSQPDDQWQYGYYATSLDAASFAQSTVWRTYFPGTNSWIGGLGEIWDSGGYPRIGKYAMSPSPDRQVVRRWTSHFKGEVTLLVDCQQLQDSVNNQKLYVLRNGVQVAELSKSESSHHLVFVESCEIDEGDELDFVIDSLGNHNADWTHLDIRVIAGGRLVTDGLIHLMFDEDNDLPVGRDGVGSLYDRRSRIADFSGSDNHATIVGMDRDIVPAVGIHDHARSFDGVDDKVVVEKSDIGDGLRELTLSAWVRPSSKENREGIFGSTGPDHFGLTFASGGEGVPVGFSAKGQRVDGPSYSCPVGEWTHVVGVWESGKSHKLFINGVEVAANSAPAGGTVDVTDWVIGADRDFTDRFFEGQLDEVMLVPRVLSDLEVSNLYRSLQPYPGINGQAQYFGGSASQYEFFEETTVGSGATELTMATWISPFGKKDNMGVLTSTGTDFFGLVLSGYGAGNPIEFRAKSVRLTGPDYSCPTGQWNHVVGVWKSGEIQKLYINGQEVASHSQPPIGALDIENWVLGNDRLFGQSRHYEGLTDEVMVLPQALTATEVDALYREHLPSGASGPVAMEGYLRWDYYWPMTNNSVDAALADRAFYDKPSRVRRFLRGSSTGKTPTESSTSHLRGYIEAPETGEYYFWISGRESAQLSIASDSSKYRKDIIARLSPDLGSQIGIGSDNDNLWDQYASQISEPIQLEAGERYYIEALQTTRRGIAALSPPHVAIAWARPSGERELIPGEFLTPYVDEVEDLDDDYLPDAWEQSYGLSITDNGFVDLEREGERGDYDADGLNNLREYLLGTDPTNSDSDGDGLSDFAEFHHHNTDPAVSNSVNETVVDDVSPESVAGLGQAWTQTADGVIGTSFRGSGSWSFTVPADGFWLLQIESRLRGNAYYADTVPVEVSIDGNSFARLDIDYQNGEFGSIRTLTPYLEAGTHSLNLFFDNYSARRSVEINGIKIIQPGGVDADGNGIPDLTEQTINGRSQVFFHQTYSYISPAFVEGTTSDPTLVDLTVITRSGQTNRPQRYNIAQWGNMLPSFEDRLSRYATRLQNQMRLGHGRMEGQAVSHEAGPGRHRWFSRIDLARNEAIGYVAQFEGLGTYQKKAIVWTPYNVLDGGSLDIPVGSDLLLGAWIQDWDWRAVTLTIEGVDHTLTGMNTHVHHFAQPGSYVITASHPDGQTGTLTVTVKDAALPGNMAISENLLTTLELPQVDPELTLDGASNITVAGLHPLASGGSTAGLAGNFPGNYRMAARMGINGPILDQENVTVVGVSDAIRMNADIVSPTFDGFFIVRSPLLITHLPAGATVEISIFAGGVTFSDGTTLKTLTAEDFDAQGVHVLEFLMPTELLRAPCHYIRIYDADGNRIYSEAEAQDQ